MNDQSAGRLRASAGPGAPRPGLKLSQDANWLAVAGPILIFAGHALYGAMIPQTALSLELGAASILMVCLLAPSVRAELSSLRGLALPALLFIAVILVGLWSMTPWAPGGPHPTWAYLGISPGASTVDKSITLLEIIKLLGLACLFFVGAATGASDHRARLAINVVLLLGALFGLWAFFEFVSGALGPAHTRLEARFMTPNAAGTVFAALLLLTLGPAISAYKSSSKTSRFTALAPYCAAGLIFVICLLMTASRGAFAATGAGLAAFGLIQVFSGRMKWSRTAVGAIVALVVIVGLLWVAGDLLISRFFVLTQDINTRAFIFQVHWEAFRASPWMGYGLGTFDVVNRTLLGAATMRELWVVRAAHNLYISWLEQAGVIGAAPMFACIAVLILVAARNTLRRSRATALLFGLLAVHVAVLVHGISDFALEIYSIAGFWSYLLGLHFSLAQGRSRG
jgi:O-antigen ligase